MKWKIVAALLIVLIVSIVIVVTQYKDNSKLGGNNSSAYVEGVWNNAEFSKQAEEWVNAAKSFGGGNGLIDLTIAQAHENGLVYLPFSYRNTGQLYSITSTDLVEKYLDKFEADGLHVMLTIQPLNADIKQLIGIILSRYSHHKNIMELMSISNGRKVEHHTM